MHPAHQPGQPGPGIGRSNPYMLFYETLDGCLELDVDSLDLITLDETCRPLPSGCNSMPLSFSMPILSRIVAFCSQRDRIARSWRRGLRWCLMWWMGECRPVNGTFAGRLRPWLTHGMLFCSQGV